MNNSKFKLIQQACVSVFYPGSMDSQVMKDDIKAAWGEIKEYMEMQLNCVMHIMASGHLRQNNDKVEKDGITTYLDVTNDCIASWRLLWQLLISILFGQLSIPSSIDVY